MSGGETIHASCVSIGGRGVLIAGRSGSGKSDLALRLIDRGAKLVSDDYTLVTRSGERLVGSGPQAIRGKIEVRGLGIVELQSIDGVPLCLLVDLDFPAERLPEPESRMLAGAALPLVRISALEASAPIKVEYALQRFGLPLP